MYDDDKDPLGSPEILDEIGDETPDPEIEEVDKDDEEEEKEVEGEEENI